MKTTLYTLFILAYFLVAASSTVVVAQYYPSYTKPYPEISWPVNYSVFQRNGTGSGATSSIVFAGQIYNNAAVSYSINRLDQYGNYQSTYQSDTPLPSGSLDALGYSLTSIYYFTRTIPTGWYQFMVKDGSNRTATIKFGVGEVFVIAGQSNAQGVNSAYVTGLPTYDCVVACKNTGDPYWAINKPIMGRLTGSENTIGPNGGAAWCYQKLGNRIATEKEPGTVVPVAFFNAALGGTCIDNWNNSVAKTRAMFSYNYSSILNPGSDEDETNGWGFSLSKRTTYMTLKNTLSLYGNVFGVRSVIWHQGEGDTKVLLTDRTFNSSAGRSEYIPSRNFVTSFDVNSYSSKLNSVINDTRSYLPNLNWAIGKVSLTSEIYQPTNALHQNITSSSNYLFDPALTNFYIGNSITQQQGNVVNPGANIYWASENSDSYNAPSYRQSDGTHLNEAGLNALADDYYNHMGSILSTSPITPSPLIRFSLSRLGANSLGIVANHPSSISRYEWRYAYYAQWANFQQQAYNDGPNSASFSFMGPSGYMCYAVDNIGRIHLSQYVDMGTYGTFRKGVDEPYPTPESLVSAYPNPIRSENTLSINFTLKEQSSMHVKIIDEKGTILDEVVQNKLDPGSHVLTFSMEKIRNKSKSKLLFYNLVTNQHNETKKIIVQE